MVRGVAMAGTARSPTYQWAVIESTARGCGRVAPSAFQARVQEFTRSAFRGLPCPRNSAGWRTLVGSLSVLRQRLYSGLVESRAQRQALAGASHVAHCDLHAPGRGAHRDARGRRERRAALATRGAPPFLFGLADALRGGRRHVLLDGSGDRVRVTVIRHRHEQLIPQPLSGGREVEVVTCGGE